MATIKIKCIDQTLQIINSPKIASGVQQINTMQFEFCPTWNDFAKKAVFYRNEKEVYNVILDAENKCVIPSEVLQEEGRIYFGVFGIKDNLRLTSEILKYDIVKGAFIEGIEPGEAPAPNIYEQLLTNYGEAMQKVNDCLREVDVKLNECREDVNTRMKNLEVYYLGETTDNPTNKASNFFNSVNKQGIYNFIYNGYSYLMFVNGNEEWCQQKILNIYAYDNKGNQISVIDRLVEEGECLSVSVDYYAKAEYVNEVKEEILQEVQSLENSLNTETCSDKVATENGLYSVEIVKPGATLPSHSVLMYVELGKGTTVMSQLKVDGTWYAVEVECWGSGKFNLRVDADIKGVFELGNVRLVKRY